MTQPHEAGPPPPPPPASPPAPGPSFASGRAVGWLWLALAVSMGVNLAVAGLVVGAGLGGRAERADTRAEVVARSAGLGPWGPAFGADDRAALRRAFERDRDAQAAQMRADRSDRMALVAALRAQPYEPSAVAEINARILSRSHDRSARGLALIEAHVRALRPAERLRMADRLEMRLPRPHRPEPPNRP